MLDFEPKSLSSVSDRLKNIIPVPRDFALKEESFSVEVLENIRANGIRFTELSVYEFNLVYKISKLCNDSEYIELTEAFKRRMNSNLFNIGWIYCQVNANEQRAIELFSLCCQWMGANKADEFAKTLVGRTGLPWDGIYLSSVDIMKIEKLSLSEFCDKFEIMSDTIFYDRLAITFLSRCDKAELIINEDKLPDLIRKTDVEFLRPAIINYATKIGIDEVSSSVYEAIAYRVAIEPGESFGLSPSVLQKIRQQQFNSVIDDFTFNNADKNNLYKDIAGRIIKVEKLQNDVYAIHFNKYIVVDFSGWDDKAYAYKPNVYDQLLLAWEDNEFSVDFWPGVDENDIVSAHNLMLGIKKGNAILLNFTGFDVLYTKDLLSSTR